MTDPIERAASFLAHMKEAAAQACAYVEGMDKPAFMDDKRTQQAVVMNLIILGEAATKLADSAPARLLHAAPTNSLEQHARHAQPSGSRLLCHRS